MNSFNRLPLLTRRITLLDKAVACMYRWYPPPPYNTPSWLRERNIETNLKLFYYLGINRIQYSQLVVKRPPNSGHAIAVGHTRMPRDLPETFLIFDYFAIDDG